MYEECLGSLETHKPRGWISSILSLTLSPISFIQLLTFSLSFASGHVLLCSVEAKSFFMYVFKLSASNFGRGDAADERDGGERRPEGIWAMKEYNRRGCTDVGNVGGLLDVVCLELSHVHKSGARLLTESSAKSNPQRRSSSELL